MEVLRVADAVEAGDGGDDYHVAAAREQGGGGGEAEFLYLVVDAQVLLDVGVGHGQVGLGLVVVVVGDKILHGVVREEGLELPVELGGKGLVVAEYQGRPLQPLDDVGLAIVNVLPEPVTPSRVTASAPALTASQISLMASGWSPVGRYGD